MLLSIDTSNRYQIIVGIDGKTFEKKAVSGSSQVLVPFIFQVLKKNKLSVGDIKKISVNTGPGSFTGLKVGLAVANALGWALDVPVNGRNLKKGESVDIVYE
jgi:tRNA threonylcarbamoyladenosine biosynthesis protein TsaB